jgi:predicted nuclease of restriction endonuclease-like (RecB) superfamily
MSIRDELILFKNEAFQLVYCKLEAQINQHTEDLNSMKESLGYEQKSSVGDKHETSRAMLQIEMEKTGQQLARASRLLEQLKQFHEMPGKSLEIAAGSLVRSNQGIFWLSIGFGSVMVPGGIVHLISAESPLGAMFLRKKPGDEFSFRDVLYRILLIA